MTTDMNTIKFATCNIGSMFNGELDAKNILFQESYKTFKELLSEQNPDVLCLQEMYNIPRLKSEICSLCRFSDVTEIFCPDSALSDGAVMEIAVFSKLPLSFADTLEIQKPFEERIVNDRLEKVHQKFFFSTEIEISNDRVLLITGHGYPSKRYNMTDDECSPTYIALDNFIKKHAYNYIDKIVVCADFNIDKPLKYMPYTSSLMVDAFVNEPTRPSGRKTDGILVPSTANIESKMNISTGLDHNYISADVLF